MRAAAALFRRHRSEIVATVMRLAEAGDRGAMRLARKHGLPVEPSPEVLAARLAQSIERTRATVAALLAEGGLERATPVRSRPAPRPGSPVPDQMARERNVAMQRNRGRHCKHQRKYNGANERRCGTTPRPGGEAFAVINENVQDQDGAMQQEQSPQRK